MGAVLLCSCPGSLDGSNGRCCGCCGGCWCEPGLNLGVTSLECRLTARQGKKEGGHGEGLPYARKGEAQYTARTGPEGVSTPLASPRLPRPSEEGPASAAQACCCCFRWELPATVCTGPDCESGG